MNSRYFKFTNCGSNGIKGPSQNDIDSEYNGTSLQNSVKSIEGIQEWNVPISGIYRITVYGAQGGARNNNMGLGAVISGDFRLQGGERLRILVGQKGGYQGAGDGAGGGGGTFVVKRDLHYKNNTYKMFDGASVSPLIIAGGGGGVNYYNIDTANANLATYGNSGTTDNSGNTAGDGGKNGYGGENNSSSSRGNGGAGFLGNGGDTYGTTYSFINGGKGGNAQSSNSPGGFGGGAGSRRNCTTGLDGGGGYSGGGGGRAGNCRSSDRAAGGGGGSFISYEVLNTPRTSNGKWDITGNEPDKAYDRNVLTLNEWNSGHGKVVIEYISNTYDYYDTNPFFTKNTDNLICKYNNFINNLFFSKYEDNTKIKVALFDKEFKFNAKDKFLSDIDLSNEISVDNYKRKKINDLEIKRKDNKLFISGNSIVWENKDIKAKYAVFYINNKKQDLLFCIDFNRIVSSNSKGKLNLKWKDQKIFELSNLSNKDLNLRIIDWLEGGKYSFEEKNSLVKKELESIQNDELLFSSLLNNNKFISLLLKSDNALSYVNKERLIKYLISENYSFKNSLGKVNKKSILDYIVENMQLFSNLLEKTNFISFLLYNKDLIVKNCNKENLIYLLKNVIDFNKDKEFLNDIYEKYKYLIDNNSDLNIVYKNKIQKLD